MRAGHDVSRRISLLLMELAQQDGQAALLQLFTG